MAEKNQKLVLAILEFLEKSIADGSVREDDKEGIEVASASFVLLCHHQTSATRRRCASIGDRGSSRTGNANPGQRVPVCLHMFPQFNALAKRLGSTLPMTLKKRN